MTSNDNKIIELRYKLLLESDDYIIIATPDSILKFVNQAYCDLIQTSAEELIGTKFTDSFSEEAIKFYTGFIKNLTSANPVVTTIQVLGSPGSEQWISWKETGIFNDEGVLLEILFVGRNVTKDFEVKRGRLLSTLNAFRQAIDSNIICTIADTTGYITYANEKFCSISKYSQEELLGKTHNIVNSGYHAKEFFADMWKTISRGNMWTGDIRNKAKDGSYYWVKSVIVPIKDEVNSITGYLSLRILINERKRMEEERAEYLRSVEDMLHIVSHEIRRPITTCQGLLNMMQDDIPQSKEEYLEAIDHLKVAAAELDAYSRKLNDYLYDNITSGKQ